MNSLQEIGANAAAITALLAALVAAWRIPIVQRGVSWINRHRREDAEAALEAVMHRVFAPTFERFDAQLSQLSPNGGSSIADRVAKIESTLEVRTVMIDSIIEQIETQGEQITALAGDVRTVLRKVST
jgi:hypothetical protein